MRQQAGCAFSWHCVMKLSPQLAICSIPPTHSHQPLHNSHSNLFLILVHNHVMFSSVLCYMFTTSSPRPQNTIITQDRCCSISAIDGQNLAQQIKQEFNQTTRFTPCVYNNIVCTFSCSIDAVLIYESLTLIFFCQSLTFMFLFCCMYDSLNFAN